jgi:LmbE family N-acetylglucosaminyl deacetylase
MDFPSAKRILVIAPHPDDDVLGAGGTLLKAIDSGTDVHVLYVTDGLPEHAASIREQTVEVCNAARMIPHFLGCRSRQIPLEDPKVNEKVTSLLESINPEVIFISFFLDDHDDHRRVNHLLRNILKTGSLPEAEIWAYQIYSSVVPNVVVNITDKVERKRELISKWKSVGKFNDLAHFILGVNASNCRFLSAQFPIFVEAFFVVPLKEYLDLCSLYFNDCSDQLYYYESYKKTNSITMSIAETPQGK